MYGTDIVAGRRKNWNFIMKKAETIAAFEREAKQREEQIANLVMWKIKQGMNQFKSGRYWYNPATGRPYRASDEGEYPAVKTGRLIRSLRVVQTPHGTFIGTATPYAKKLEEGYEHPTAGWIHRPFITRAFSEMYDRIQGILTKHWTLTHVGGRGAGSISDHQMGDFQIDYPE